MKKTVFTKKLKSKTGASMLLALAFFLMCFFVASVVMASASVNASRAMAQKEEQRSYFAIQSAQNLIKDMFKEINGKNLTDNALTITLGSKTGDSGETIPIETTAYGGFHLREVNTVYDWCNEGRTYALYGKMEKDGSGPLLNAEGNDVAYNASSFGLDCIGDESVVFAKDAIEEVASLVICKRLHDQGVNSLDGYGQLSTYFAAVDDDFNIATATVSESSSVLKYVYYFDITPADDAGDYKTNLPTVHVKMTADNKANLTFVLTVDSKFAATYSATVKATATIETITPPSNELFENPLRATPRCPELSTDEKTEYHLVTRTINDTYVTWYTDKIEITKGVKAKKTA